MSEDYEQKKIIDATSEDNQKDNIEEAVEGDDDFNEEEEAGDSVEASENIDSESKLNNFKRILKIIFILQVITVVEPHSLKYKIYSKIKLKPPQKTMRGSTAFLQKEKNLQSKKLRYNFNKHCLF